MADENDYFTPEHVEEQVARLRQPLASQADQDTPDERQLIEDLRRLYAHERADDRSLETVWSRLESQAISGRGPFTAADALAPVGHPPARVRRVVSLFSVVAAVLVIIVVVTAIVVSRAQPNTGPAHQVVGSPTPTPVLTETAYTPTPNDGLNAVQMLSPTEGWAVGEAYIAPSGKQPSSNKALILHYHNGQWLRAPAPSLAQLGVSNATLDSISMLSADDGWAVGVSFSSDKKNPVPSTFILHYSGGKWTSYGGLLPDAELVQVQMLSPTDGWASGGSDFTGGIYVTNHGATASLLLHYDGTSWTPVRTPPVDNIGTLDMLSPTDGWATGTDTILHYDGQQWTSFQDAPQVQTLSMDSASDGWAIGMALYGALNTTFWHYNGKQWVQSSFPNSSAAVYDLAQVISMDSPTDGWAVGWEGNYTSQKFVSLYLHYSQGHWTKVQGLNVGISAVTMLSANEGWAVGGDGGGVVVLHYQHGAWSQYKF